MQNTGVSQYLFHTRPVVEVLSKLWMKCSRDILVISQCSDLFTVLEKWVRCVSQHLFKRSRCLLLQHSRCCEHLASEIGERKLLPDLQTPNQNGSSHRNQELLDASGQICFVRETWQTLFSPPGYKLLAAIFLTYVYKWIASSCSIYFAEFANFQRQKSARHEC